MITDHVWRCWHEQAQKGQRSTRRVDKCGYMNCRRPPDEHERRTGPYLVGRNARPTQERC